MCPLGPQLWISAGTVGCAQLVGPEHILVRSICFRTPFWAQDTGLFTIQVEMLGKSKHFTKQRSQDPGKQSNGWVPFANHSPAFVQGSVLGAEPGEGGGQAPALPGWRVTHTHEQIRLHTARADVGHPPGSGQPRGAGRGLARASGGPERAAPGRRRAARGRERGKGKASVSCLKCLE